MSKEVSQRDSDSENQAPSLDIADIYFVLFRRKGMVVLGLLFGLAAAGGLWKLKAPLFESTAKLMVGYVRQEMGAPTVGPGSTVRSATSGGTTMISEGEIIRSLDVARAAGEVIGPPLIVPPGSPTNDCAPYIVKHLNVDISPQSDVMTIRFSHPDYTLAKSVLTEIIEAYLKKHQRVHTDMGTSAESLKQQRFEFQSALTNIDLRLKDLTAKVGVSSLEDFKKHNAAEESRLNESLVDAEAELAEKQAMAPELVKTSATNALSIEPSSIPRDKVRDYALVLTDIDRLHLEEEEVLRSFTPASERFKAVHARVERAMTNKMALEKQYPGLLREQASLVTPAGVLAPPTEPKDARLQIRGLQAKITVLSNQLHQVQMKARDVEGVESEMLELQRRRELILKQIGNIDLQLQQRQFDQVGSTPNIQRVQAPSAPSRDFLGLYKKMAMAVLGGLGGGIGLAFLFEMLLDRRLKRPKDVQGAVAAPLFISIPSLRLKGGARPADGALVKGQGRAEVPLEPDAAMRPFNEALRDRLIHYFEVRNMTHMPKMIAVTSCDSGAGVSTVATGLAASLSETGEGNVLLVDARGGPGAAHAFFKGRPACGLDEALAGESRSNALVQGNLYAVTASSPESKLERIMPRQFGNFMPKLRASDYEYIIFDMPPVEPTSVTSKVARFMDMVLMVVEADKTNREVANRAGALLQESKSPVATVLNKRRQYVPKWLLQEFD